jgi:hypothetical protein
MKFLTIVRPGPMPPPPDVVRAGQQWLHQKLDDGTFECVYSFVAAGGFSIGNADSIEGQMDLLGEYPLAPFVQYEVHPLVELDYAFEHVLALLDRAAAQMPQTG